MVTAVRKFNASALQTQSALTLGNLHRAQGSLNPKVQFVVLVLALCTVLKYSTLPWSWHS